MKHQVGRFLVAGVLSVAVDTALLVALYDGVGLVLWLATTLAFTGSLVVNFGLNKQWVFSAEGLMGRRLGRYVVMVAINLALTLSIVLALTGLGLWYVLAKWAAVAICAAVNFVGFRVWVFRLETAQV